LTVVAAIPGCAGGPDIAIVSASLITGVAMTGRPATARSASARIS
jgi:hypothetical protein